MTKYLFKTLILMAYIFSIQAMQEDIQSSESIEFAFNTVCKHKYNFINNDHENVDCTELSEEFSAIAQYAALKLNELASNNINLIFLFPIELPSLTIAYETTIKTDPYSIEWKYSGSCLERNQLTEEEIVQLEKFQMALKEIIMDTQAQLESLGHLYPANLTKESFMKIKVQLHFKDLHLEEELEPEFSWIEFLKSYIDPSNIYPSWFPKIKIEF